MKNKKPSKIGTPTYISKFLPISQKDNSLLQRLNDIADISKREEVLFRLKVIEYSYKYGIQPTIEAFNVCRASIYKWRKLLKDNNGDISVLVSKSKAPKRKRQKKRDPKIIDFIYQLRKQHPRLGKEKIKPLLDKFCKENKIQTISVSTIGEIIKELRERGLLRHETRRKYTINARSGNLIERRDKRRNKSKERTKNITTKPGQIVQIDTIVYMIEGIRRYIFTAIDLKSRFSFAYGYERISSRNAKDFIEKLLRVVPFKVEGIKTDNGSEFDGEFDKYLRDKGIKHYYNYPRNPKGNAYVERLNRTLQEGFIDWNTDKIDDINLFNKELVRYMIWYNTDRPHKGLRGKTPLGYYVDFLIETGFSPDLSNMLATHTNIGIQLKRA